MRQSRSNADNEPRASRARGRRARQPCTRSTCSSPPLAVEVAAHFKLGRRSIALAFRLEEFYGRWLCTAVELGPRA